MAMEKGIIRNVSTTDEFVVSDDDNNFSVFGDNIRIKHLMKGLISVYVHENDSLVGILYFRSIEDRRRGQ
ncbi:MAG: hypothetical protein JRJ78_14115 [Deltaproteobacteria bacterium]|nr:hypothetical protein [Deltaproteobacteria bacterium]